MRSVIIASALALAVLAMPSAHTAVAATLPPGFSETQIGGLTQPTAMAFAPDGRLFVAEQTGSLRVIKNDALLVAPFVTLTVESSGERGLLGVAFDPNFASNQYVYVYYTSLTLSVHNRVSRFTASGDVATGGETVLLDLDDLGATNHNGGAIHFGPDGKLYIAVGDNANGANAQTPTNLLGKMLRMNADGTIPTDNPFYSTATDLNRLIWAMGLRNPFTFAFQAGTGRMFIDDVGQNTWEEIDDGIAGANYGWPNAEGVDPNPLYLNPLFAYGHGSTSTTGCAITGGVFYNPVTPQFPAGYGGKYFFADVCSGWIRLFDPAIGTASLFASGLSGPVDLEVSTDGSLYALEIGAGAVARIRYDGTDTDGDGCPDANEFANLGLGKKPDNANDPTDFADADHSGKVEVRDFSMLLTAWNTTPSDGSPPYDSRVNFDTSNPKINVGDFSILVNTWNRKCVN